MFRHMGDREMKIKIEEVYNGYVITDYVWENTNTEDGTKIIEEEICVVETEDLTEEESYIKILEAIADKLGYTYDKFSKNNLNIKFDKKGHKA